MLTCVGTSLGSDMDDNSLLDPVLLFHRRLKQVEVWQGFPKLSILGNWVVSSLGDIMNKSNINICIQVFVGKPQKGYA